MNPEKLAISEVVEALAGDPRLLFAFARRYKKDHSFRMELRLLEMHELDRAAAKLRHPAGAA